MKSMNISKKVLFVLFTIILSSIIFNGCGYKPSSYYAKKELNGKVYVNLNVNLQDPKNTVLIKDAMNQLLIQKLDAKLVNDRSQADIIMNLSLGSVSLATIQYDAQGYNKVYRATVSIAVNYKKLSDNSSKSFSVSGENTFSVDDSTSTITDTKRFEAIKSASDDALNEVLSKIAINSFK